MLILSSRSEASMLVFATQYEWYMVEYGMQIDRSLRQWGVWEKNRSSLPTEYSVGFSPFQRDRRCPAYGLHTIITCIYSHNTEGFSSRPISNSSDKLVRYQYVLRSRTTAISSRLVCICALNYWNGKRESLPALTRTSSDPSQRGRSHELQSSHRQLKPMWSSWFNKVIANEAATSSFICLLQSA